MIWELARRYWWAFLALLAFGFGWLAAGWTRKPVSEVTKALLDSLKTTHAAYLEQTEGRRKAEMDARRLISALSAEKEAKDDLVAAKEQAATLLRRESVVLGRRLALATTVAESLEVRSRQVEALDAAYDSLEAGLEAAHAARAVAEEQVTLLSATLEVMREQRVADSTRLVMQEAAIGGLVKAKLPCQRWCPTLVGTYDVRDAALAVGAGVRPRPWLTVGATYRVID